MDIQMFAECMKPVQRACGHDLTDEQFKFYFEELGSTTPKKLSEAVRLHRTKFAKKFPSTEDLRKNLYAQGSISSETNQPEHHPEYSMHLNLIGSMLESEIHGGPVTIPENYTFLVDARKIIDYCMKIYSDTKVDEKSIPWYAEIKRINRAHAAMTQIIMRLFQGIRQ